MTIKMCVIKRKLKFQDHKTFLETAQPKIKLKHLEKNKSDVDTVKDNKKETNKDLRVKSTLFFTEEIKKIALSWNDSKNAINWFDRNIRKRNEKKI